MNTIAQSGAPAGVPVHRENAGLIVNADDFGYSVAISRGIVECANRGIVTATGVFGNAPDLRECVRMLADAPALETGVHLTLSHGKPLTREMSRALRSCGESFPGKFHMAALITLGRVARAVVRDEWRAQIERCLEHGLALQFLNSHEHLHMHPRVFPIVAELAHQFGIRHIRVTRPEPIGGGGAGGFVRSVVLRLLAPSPRSAHAPALEFLGLSRSGRVDVPYLEKLLAVMRPGNNYELMCHPGFDDPHLGRDAKLRRYHDWDLERRSLQDARLPDLLARHHVELVRYAGLPALPTG